MLLAPYYRSYELAWEGDPESTARFRKILRVGLIVLAVLGVVFPLLPKPRHSPGEDAIPPRLARVRSHRCAANAWFRARMSPSG